MAHASRSFLISLFVLATFAPDLGARIISYAPVTDQFGRPAVQQRENRYYLLVESAVGAIPPSPFPGGSFLEPVSGTIVLHDVTGADEPRQLMVTAPDGNIFTIAALHQSSTGDLRILVGTDADLNGGRTSSIRYLYSPDAGAHWQIVGLDPALEIPDYFRPDVGGPVVRGRGTQVRLGNDATPFVFAAHAPWANGVPGRVSMFALDANGSVRKLAQFAAGSSAMLIGCDQSGSSFLVTGRLETDGVAAANGIRTLKLDGTIETVAITDDVSTAMEGWITPARRVFVESQHPGGTQQLNLFEGGTVQAILPQPPQTTAAGPLLFSVPTADFEGAWIVRRTPSQPTRLYLHDGTSLKEQWADVTAPAIEAVHASRSGSRVLIQVHRERVDDNRIIIDPALAIWQVGTSAPTRYDELFLSEGEAKMFVSLDVDAVADGAPFVFDSAPVEQLPPPPISSAPGGGDISQEWGVVRASLRQRLVLPALARLEGGYGSFWKTDLILANGDATPLEVELRFAQSGAESQITKTIVLEANEIRLVPDALKSLFDMERGGGALFLTPEAGRDVGVTSRTYSESSSGTFGMGVGATDLFASSSARFPLTFAGAFQGEATRTNLLVVDAAARGTKVGFNASGPTGTTGRTGLEFETTRGGQIQINDLATVAAVPPSQSGALRFETRRGQSIPMLVSIDNKTNDPTMFPPDVTANVTRVIPIIGHVDGANGSRFRTDLFLYNPSPELKSVILASKPLDEAVFETTVWFTLLPFESKRIPDVYQTVFQRTGLGRLRFQSDAPWETGGIRVSARIYTVDDSGGTYGYVMPALNAFQSASAGESVEILGGVIDPRFRLNLAIVDTAGQPNGQSQRVNVEIFASGGTRLDSFETNVPNAGGIQLADLLTARGLTSANPSPVVIRVSPLGGNFGVFATMIDNRTNDPTYLGAGLASH
ncbi:MAG: hypothetical protein HYU52_18215 [Acidobacteria bacterium]|nr:hypothetical protein [Acidobacteriota bacterium]